MGLKPPPSKTAFFNCGILTRRYVSVSMLVFEAKLEGLAQQYERLDEAIRTARFVRNSCLRYWLDNLGIGKYELSAYCAVLAALFPFAGKLNSQAR
jgi:putative transposase